MGTAAGGGEPDTSRRSLPASIRRQGQKGGNFLRCIAPPCCFERPLVVSLPLPWGEHKAEASSGGADLKTEAGLRCLSEASFYFWPLFYSREAMVFFFWPLFGVAKMETAINPSRHLLPRLLVYFMAPCWPSKRCLWNRIDVFFAFEERSDRYNEPAVAVAALLHSLLFLFRLLLPSEGDKTRARLFSLSLIPRPFLLSHTSSPEPKSKNRSSPSWAPSPGPASSSSAPASAASPGPWPPRESAGRAPCSRSTLCPTSSPRTSASTAT